MTKRLLHFCRLWHICNEPNKNIKRGFTLVELSIVLVIIGLIVASVLVGQDLIRQAELRASITQYEQFNAAANTFRTKYGQLPGDIYNGSTFFSGASNGDGNGLIGSSASSAATATMATETLYFWDHLDAGAAALIPGTYTVGTASLGITFPKAKIGQGWGVYSNSVASNINYYILGASNNNSAVYAVTNVLNPLDARSIDLKVDDGLPLVGHTQARATGAGDPEAGGPFTALTFTATAGTTTACVLGSGGAYGAANRGGYTYNVQNAVVTCALRMRMYY
jgi:prepilin-type N-terminal cleavage/methylation domain-containing protein